VGTFERSRVVGPDILRGLAACGVVLFHVLYLSGLEISNIPHYLVGRFDFLVRLFFAVSAFSLAYAYHGKYQGSAWIKGFYIRRFFRIAPLYYFVVFLGIAHNYLGNGQAPGVFSLGANLLFVFSLAPGLHGGMAGGAWSLGVEWLFYLAFPLMSALITSIRVAITVWAIFCGVAIFGREYFSSFMDGGLREFGLLFFLSHVHYFVIGLIVFIIYESRANWRPSKKKWPNGVFSVCLLGLVVLYFNGASDVPEELVISFVVFGLLLLAVWGFPVWLDNEFTRYLGSISYSVYLLQFPVIQALAELGVYRFALNFSQNATAAFALASAVTLVVTLIVSALTFQFIEIPGQSFGRALAKK